MFDGLRKKLGNVVKSFAKREKQEIQEEIEETPEQPEEAVKREPAVQAPEEEARQETPAAKPQQETSQKEVPPAKAQETKVEASTAPAKQETVRRHSDGIKLSVGTRIKGALLRSVKLNDKDINNFIEELKISMLESDTAYETTEEFLERMRAMLKEGRFSSSNVGSSIEAMARDSMLDVLRSGNWKFDLDEEVNRRINSGETPVKILFLGPNGTGKTTTIAKLAHRFKSRGIGCVMSASDTFRAAAIEQTEHHAKMIGVPVIKSGYGADPASIAFDAIAYAKAHGTGIVLIDSAGRQETNRNLISEVQKMVRVAKPDVIIFVGESTTGNAIATQIAEFAKYIKIDGIILTKLDCDAKGGSAISISKVTGVPIIYFGVGESYDALVKYSPEMVVDNIFGNN